MFSTLRQIGSGLLLLGVLLAMGWPSAAVAQSTGERALLEGRQQEFAAAMASRDAARVAAFFTDGGLLHIANQPALEGRAGIERFYSQVFRFLAATEMTPGELRFGAGEDLAYATARVTNTFERDGQRTDYTGKSLIVWERADGVWKVAVYALSNNRSESAAR